MKKFKWTSSSIRRRGLCYARHLGPELCRRLECTGDLRHTAEDAKLKSLITLGYISGIGIAVIESLSLTKLRLDSNYFAYLPSRSKPSCQASQCQLVVSTSLKPIRVFESAIYRLEACNVSKSYQSSPRQSLRQEPIDPILCVGMSFLPLCGAQYTLGSPPLIELATPLACLSRW